MCFLAPLVLFSDMCSLFFPTIGRSVSRKWKPNRTVHVLRLSMYNATHTSYADQRKEEKNRRFRTRSILPFTIYVHTHFLFVYFVVDASYFWCWWFRLFCFLLFYKFFFLFFTSCHFFCFSFLLFIIFLSVRFVPPFFFLPSSLFFFRLNYMFLPSWCVRRVCIRTRKTFRFNCITDRRTSSVTCIFL